MSTVAPIDFQPLNLLLKASSKQQVIDLLNKAFDQRDKAEIEKSVLEHIGGALSANISEAEGLVKSICSLIKTALYQGLQSTEEIGALFPATFHKNLAELLTKIIVENYSDFKAKVTRNLISLPKMVQYSWRIDMKMASATEPRINYPSCILQIQAEDPSLPPDHKNKLMTIHVELSKNTVNNMLDQLGRVRDQLGAVAKK